MLHLLKTRFFSSRSGQDGYTLIMVLVFMLVGSLIIVPLLELTTTAFRAGFIYTDNTDELYAADAGIQDGEWMVKYDYLQQLLTVPPYDSYNFTAEWQYAIDQPINEKTVDVSIYNVWIPNNISAPDEAEASAIIDAEKLVVTSGSTGTNCKINITYTPGAQESLNITSLGIWLPRGYTYVNGSSNLESDHQAEYYCVPEVQSYAGNQALLWNFSAVSFSEFPGVNTADIPMVSEITFQFTAVDPEEAPTAVAWVTTSGVSDIPYSWDADIKVFKITAVAGQTSIESYMVKEEIRRLRSAVNGDYCATGNSLMIDTNHDSHGIRDQLLSSSNATVSSIPDDAGIRAAFLYWSAYRGEAAKQTIFTDACGNFTNWTAGSNWSINSGEFRGHYGSGVESTRLVTLTSGLDLSSYAPGTVTLSWYQSEEGTLEADDGLDFSVSADGGTTWSDRIEAFRNDIGSSGAYYCYMLPSQYFTNNFKVQYYLADSSGSGEYIYIDNIAVSIMPPDTSVVFMIDGQQVYFDASGDPAQGVHPIISENTQVLPNYDTSDNPNGYSYSCYADVTDLIKTFSAKQPDPAINRTGNGVYTVGEVTGDLNSEWSYAGWSLVLIYTSADTQGHQLFLYDSFTFAGANSNIDFNCDGQPGGQISGFIVPPPIDGEANAAKLTVFVGEGDNCYTGDYIKLNGTNLSNAQSPANNVWNSQSPGITADGVDIDTFYITWASGIIQAGDASAQIDLPTQVDNWNLVYIIVSFRSETTTGGSLNYLIR